MPLVTIAAIRAITSISTTQRKHVRHEHFIDETNRADIQKKNKKERNGLRSREIGTRGTTLWQRRRPGPV